MSPDRPHERGAQRRRRRQPRPPSRAATHGPSESTSTVPRSVASRPAQVVAGVDGRPGRVAAPAVRRRRAPRGRGRRTGPWWRRRSPATPWRAASSSATADFPERVPPSTSVITVRAILGAEGGVHGAGHPGPVLRARTPEGLRRRPSPGRARSRRPTRCRCPATPPSSSACTLASVTVHSRLASAASVWRTGTKATTLTVPAATVARPSVGRGGPRPAASRPTVASTRTPASSAAATAATSAAVSIPTPEPERPSASAHLGDVGADVAARVVRRHLHVETQSRSPMPPPTGAVDAASSGASSRQANAASRRRSGRGTRGGRSAERVQLGRAQYSMPFMARTPRS